jgi:hypothetical protein
MAPQIIVEHGFGPCFIYPLFLAEKGKQAEETG